MQTPLEIAFHNLPPTDWAEADIRERVSRLEERCSHLVGCRVRVERENNSHRTGHVYQVHIELTVPGRDLMVTKEPHGMGRRIDDAPDLQTVIRQAFKSAERQLTKFKDIREGEVKQHYAPAVAASTA